MGLFDSSVSSTPTSTKTVGPNQALQPYSQDVLQKGQALLDAGTPAYTGQMTAGTSELQDKAWQGLSNLTLPKSMTEASTRLGDLSEQAANYRFDPSKIQDYMNPYIKQALDPQLEEMRRQSQINLQPYLSKITSQGGYGGGREAILRSEANRNLLQEQTRLTGQGYKDAYDNAMKSAQYASDLGLKGITTGIQGSQAQSNAGGQEAQYGLQNLQALSSAGKTQQEQEQAGLNAQYNEYLRQLNYLPNALKNQQQLIQGMPGGTEEKLYGATPSTFQQTVGASAGIASLIKNMKDSGLTAEVIAKTLRSLGFDSNSGNANDGATVDPNEEFRKSEREYRQDPNSMVDDGATVYQNYSEAPTNTDSNYSYYPNYSEAPEEKE
jgi:hypothetical protein